MIKKGLFILCLYFSLPFNKSIAQSSPFADKLGVSADELNYKECPFDKEATAVVFVDEAESDYNDEYNLITYHHVKLKILKDKGIEYGNIEIPYYLEDDFENISSVEGTIYNNDNMVSSRKLDKKSVYTQKENKYWGEVKFAFPEVKAGSIIEYTYESSKKSYGGLKEWIFQQEIPVLKSKYLVTILPNTEFAYAVQKSPEMNIDIKPNNSEGKITFEMDNIAGLRDEKYIDSKNDYLQKVSFQLSKFQDRRYMTSWDQVNNEMFTDADFYGQLKKNLSGTDDFIKSLQQDNIDLSKMKKVYAYVRNNITWNNINSKYSPDGVKQAWDKKTGTSGDINLILINLLRQAGLDANPMLVSERYNGRVHRETTMVDQFNTVYACVTINNKQYYLDATDKYNSCTLTPYEILNTTAFIVTRKKGNLIDIIDTTALYRENISIDATVNKEGLLNATFAANSIDYARDYRVKNLRTNTMAENEKLFAGNTTGLNFSDFKTVNADSDLVPLTTKGSFSMPLNNSNEYYFLTANLLTGLNDNPFISENRFSNINFGYKQSIQLSFLIEIDKSFTIDALPKSVKLTDPDGDIIFTRLVYSDKEQNVMKIVSTFEIKQNLYPVSQYEIIKNFYKKLFEMLNEQIVLKKK
ncbi:MAG TPA: DUF3857 domain-containing protein [Ginsengibacter sp.]